MHQIGKRTSLKSSLDVANEYNTISEKNLKAARLLMKNEMYNEAYYYFIQSMEKSIKKKICEIIDVTNPYFAGQLKNLGHSLDNAVEFLLKLVSGNNSVLYEQIKKQIVAGVLLDIRFSSIHNNVRYPYFSQYKNEYSFLYVTYNDCLEIEQMEKRLKKFLNELHRL